MKKSLVTNSLTVRQCLILLIAILLTPLVGWAVPTGLRIIPTAEILTGGQQRYEYEGEGSGKLYMPLSSTVYGVQSVVASNTEGGIDQVSHVGQVYNLKWQFLAESALPALAFGVQNIASGEKVQYYLVGSKTFSQLRLHGGVLRDVDHTYVTLLGTNLTYGMFTATADRARGGRFDRTSYAIAVTFSGFSIIGSEYHLENQPRTRTLSVAYTR